MSSSVPSQNDNKIMKKVLFWIPSVSTGKHSAKIVKKLQELVPKEGWRVDHVPDKYLRPKHGSTGGYIKIVSRMVDFLLKKRVEGEQIHLIGHAYGANIAYDVATYAQVHSKLMCGFIIAINPVWGVSPTTSSKNTPIATSSPVSPELQRAVEQLRALASSPDMFSSLLPAPLNQLYPSPFAAQQKRLQDLVYTFDSVLSSTTNHHSETDNNNGDTAEFVARRRRCNEYSSKHDRHDHDHHDHDHHDHDRHDHSDSEDEDDSEETESTTVSDATLNILAEGTMVPSYTPTQIPLMILRGEQDTSFVPLPVKIFASTYEEIDNMGHALKFHSRDLWEAVKQCIHPGCITTDHSTCVRTCVRS